MPSLFASVTKDLGSQSRDLSGLVRQIKDILPQYSDEAVCEALVEADEDVSRAMNLLLNRPAPTKPGKKKKERKNVPPEFEHNLQGSAGPAGPLPEEPCVEIAEENVREDRPKTDAERQAMKWRKKLRDIEHIEDRLARGEKVDPLQLPKLEKKAEFEQELHLAEARVREETHQRALAKQEASAAAAAEKAAAAAAAAEAVRVAQQREAAQQQVVDKSMVTHQSLAVDTASHSQHLAPHLLQQMSAMPVSGPHLQQQQMTGIPQRQSVASQLLPRSTQEMPARTEQRQQEGEEEEEQQHHQQPNQHKGMELLSMLHASGPQVDAQHRYEQSLHLAQELSEHRGHVLPGQGWTQTGSGLRPPNQPSSPYSVARHNDQTTRRQAHHASAPNHVSQNWWTQPRTRDGEASWAHDECIEGADEAPPEPDAPAYGRDFENQYSTPLDMSRIPESKRREAERIAREIEEESRGGGWGELDSTRGSSSWGDWDSGRPGSGCGSAGRNAGWADWDANRGPPARGRGSGSTGGGKNKAGKGKSGGKSGTNGSWQ